MRLRKPPNWSLQPGLVARPRREHWRAVKAVFPFWEAEDGLSHTVPRFSRWRLGECATRRPTQYGPAADLSKVNRIWMQADVCFRIQITTTDEAMDRGSDLWFTSGLSRPRASGVSGSATPATMTAYGRSLPLQTAK